MRHLARLCWNTNGWTRPAGVAPAAEGQGGNETFVTAHGYGHEEWLFHPEHRIDGRQFGFLQPSLHAAEERLGPNEPLHVVLYTIGPDRERRYLGRIDNVELLDAATALQARNTFDERGWTDRMAEDLEALGLATGALRVAHAKSRELVNVAFAPSDVHLLPEALGAAPDDITRQPGMNRYQFYPLDELPAPIVGTRADPHLPVAPYQYVTAPVVEADPRHNRLQLHLAALLRARHGHDAVALEVDGIDIVLFVEGTTTFIEVKSESDPRAAVRAALGQLLEYAMFARPGMPLPRLVIAAPGEVTTALNAYLELLRTRHAIDVHYVRIDETLNASPL